MKFSWSIKEIDSGVEIARGYGPSQCAALQELNHYLLQYAQDGPMSYELKRGSKRLMCGEATAVVKMKEQSGGTLEWYDPPKRGD